jgi:hypothetical protein
VREEEHEAAVRMIAATGTASLDWSTAAHVRLPRRTRTGWAQASAIDADRATAAGALLRGRRGGRRIRLSLSVVTKNEVWRIEKKEGRGGQKGRSWSGGRRRTSSTALR